MDKRKPKNKVKIPVMNVADSQVPIMQFDDFQCHRILSRVLQKDWKLARDDGYIPKPASQVRLK